MGATKVRLWVTKSHVQDISEALAVAKGQLYSLAREKLHQIGEMAGHTGGERYSKEEIKILVAGEWPGGNHGNL